MVRPLLAAKVGKTAFSLVYVFKIFAAFYFVHNRILYFSKGFYTQNFFISLFLRSILALLKITPITKQFIITYSQSRNTTAADTAP